LPTFDSPDLQTAVAFLPKRVVDVRAVEVLQGVRMTGGRIERFGFRIPRPKMEFFQDDVFIHTRDTGKAVMSAGQFLEGKDDELPLIDLRPDDMIPRNDPNISSPLRFPSPLPHSFVCGTNRGSVPGACRLKTDAGEDRREFVYEGYE
jgi:Type of WD40 repeat